jgi:HPt (histidine-containing phosphotransfer) domain-containing protein
MSNNNLYNLHGNADKLGVSSDVLKSLLLKAIPGYLSEVEELKSLESKRDFPQLKKAAHKLKGSFGNYLLEKAYDCAVEINDKADEEKDFDYKDRIRQIEEYLKDLNERMENA